MGDHFCMQMALLGDRRQALPLRGMIRAKEDMTRLTGVGEHFPSVDPDLTRRLEFCFSQA